MSKEYRSFRSDVPFEIDKKGKKWWQFRKMDRKEYGKTAFNYTVIGIVFSTLISSTIFGAFTLIGLLSAVIWLILTILEKFKVSTKVTKEKEVDIPSFKEDAGRKETVIAKSHGKYLYVGISIFIISALFVWLYVMPILAKRHCNSVASDASMIRVSRTPLADIRDNIPPHLVRKEPTSEYDQDKYDFEYVKCLRSWGI